MIDVLKAHGNLKAQWPRKQLQKDRVEWNAVAPDCCTYIHSSPSWFADFMLALLAAVTTTVALLFHSGAHSDSEIRIGA